MNKNTIPTVVITQYDGNILLDILDKNRDNVQARLEAESDVDVVGGGHGHIIGTAIVLLHAYGRHVHIWKIGFKSAKKLQEYSANPSYKPTGFNNTNAGA